MVDKLPIIYVFTRIDPDTDPDPDPDTGNAHDCSVEE